MRGESWTDLSQQDSTNVWMTSNQNITPISMKLWNMWDSNARHTSWADLTEEAQRILDRISLAAMSPESKITVTGHTDDVPLIFGGQYRDNWDLAAARASSVVQELSKSGTIPSDKLRAISFGETKPIEQNDTKQGREKNRRIEIEIKY